MKKLLAIFGTTGLVISTSSILVSCEPKENIETLVKDATLTLGTNDLKNKQIKIELDNLNETNILSIENNIVKVTLTESSILIEAKLVGSSTIEVISTPVKSENEDNIIFEENINEDIIQTINVTVVGEESSVEAPEECGASTTPPKDEQEIYLTMMILIATMIQNSTITIMIT